jgi:hypothetical protein
MTVVQLGGEADGLNESGTYQWFPEDVTDEEDEVVVGVDMTEKDLHF